MSSTEEFSNSLGGLLDAKAPTQCTLIIIIIIIISSSSSSISISISNIIISNSSSSSSSSSSRSSSTVDFRNFIVFLLGRDPGTLKSDIVSTKSPQLICSDLDSQIENSKIEIMDTDRIIICL